MEQEIAKLWEAIEELRKEIKTAKCSNRGVRPELEDVKSYGITMAIGPITCEKFHNFFESNGWKVGRNPMKDWKAALRNWASKETPMPQAQLGLIAPKKRTVYELKSIIEAKEKIAKSIKDRYTFEAAMGIEWTDKTARNNYGKLREEIKKLNEELASL